MQYSVAKFSVLLPILERVDISKGLPSALKSIFENTIHPDQVVVTVDGKVSESFKKFINIEISKKIDDLLVEISTLDHPGLLSKICEAFDSFDLMVKDAKISTLGEEANDIFVLFPFNKGKKVTSQNIIELKNKIKLKISELYV